VPVTPSDDQRRADEQHRDAATDRAANGRPDPTAARGEREDENDAEQRHCAAGNGSGSFDASFKQAVDDRYEIVGRRRPRLLCRCGTIRR
jgi:hypothetical protein